jgi:hypothetical protein
MGAKRRKNISANGFTDVGSRVYKRIHVYGSFDLRSRQRRSGIEIAWFLPNPIIDMETKKGLGDGASQLCVGVAGTNEGDGATATGDVAKAKQQPAQEGRFEQTRAGHILERRECGFIELPLYVRRQGFVLRVIGYGIGRILFVSRATV